MGILGEDGSLTWNLAVAVVVLAVSWLVRSGVPWLQYCFVLLGRHVTSSCTDDRRGNA